MFKLKKCLLTVFVLSGYYSFAQPSIVVHKFDSLYQVCLYTGDNQVHCAGRYATEMDSMLNVVYSMLRVRCDTNGRVKLKNEQDQWIIERDKYFTTVSTENVDKEMSGEGEQVIVLGKEAGYVRKRVVQLIDRLTY